MKKVVCPDCQRPSYTTATEANLPCPHCGFFLYGEGGPDRRGLKRILTQNACEILKDEVRIVAEAVDISKAGVGVKTSKDISFDKGESVNILIKDFEIEGNAQVVWVQSSNSAMCKMGLKFI